MSTNMALCLILMKPAPINMLMPPSAQVWTQDNIDDITDATDQPGPDPSCE